MPGQCTLHDTDVRGLIFSVVYFLVAGFPNNCTFHLSNQQIQICFRWMS